MFYVKSKKYIWTPAYVKCSNVNPEKVIYV